MRRHPTSPMVVLEAASRSGLRTRACTRTGAGGVLLRRDVGPGVRLELGGVVKPSLVDELIDVPASVDVLVDVAAATLTEAERRELARRIAPWNTRRRSRHRTGPSIPGYDLLAGLDAANPPARSRWARGPR